MSVINALNKLDHRDNLVAAIRSGKAFFGRVKDDVLAVDYDTDGSIEAANRLYWSARMMGLPALMLASGQPGRRHVFVWTIDAHQLSELALLAKADDGDVRIDIRPPLAPHRWHAEGVEASILRGQDLVLAFGRTGEIPTKSWRRAIRLAAINGGSTYQSGSEFIGAAALAAVNAGWTVDEFEDLLESPGSKAAEAYAARSKPKGAVATKKWLRDYVWSSAERQVKEHPALRQEPDPQVRQLLAQVGGLAWPGRGGPSDRAVHLALQGKAELVGQLTVNCSRRELMSRAGLTSRKTVDNALQRLLIRKLIERDLLSQVKRPTGTPARYRWTSTWHLLPVQSMPDEDGRSLGVDLGSVSHDAFFNHCGLGKYAHRIWTAVAQAPGSKPSDLAASLNFDPRTVRRHLACLGDVGLVEQDQDGRWFPLGRSLDAAAADLGNVGRSEKLLMQHQRERVNYDNFQRRRGCC